MSTREFVEFRLHLNQELRKWSYKMQKLWDCLKYLAGFLMICLFTAGNYQSNKVILWLAIVLGLTIVVVYLALFVYCTKMHEQYLKKYEAKYSIWVAEGQFCIWGQSIYKPFSLIENADIYLEVHDIQDARMSVQIWFKNLGHYYVQFKFTDWFFADECKVFPVADLEKDPLIRTVVRNSYRDYRFSYTGLQFLSLIVQVEVVMSRSQAAFEALKQRFPDAIPLEVVRSWR